MTDPCSNQPIRSVSRRWLVSASTTFGPSQGLAGLTGERDQHQSERFLKPIRAFAFANQRIPEQLLVDNVVSVIVVLACHRRDRAEW